MASSSPRERSISEELTEEQLAEIKRAFHMYDSSGSGFLTLAGSRNAMNHLGISTAEAKLQDWFNEADTDEDGKLNFLEFLNLTGPRIKDPESDEAVLKASFDFFDRDKDGFIDFEEMHQTFAKLARINPTREETEEMMREADANGDGKLSYEEFVMMVRRREQQA